MKNFSKLVNLAFLFLYPIVSQGAGTPSITGVANDGYTVSIDCDGGPCTVEIWIKSKDMKLSKKTWQGFYKEPCVYSDTFNALGEETRTLSCDSTAKSPLAGTKYIGKRFNGNCEQGDPDFQFVCISGCNSNNRAPLKMKQDHWEC